MSQKIIQRSEVNKGLNLVTSNRDRLPIYASSMKNAQYRKSGAPEKRLGNHIFAESQGGIGADRYNRVDPLTGIVVPEYLTLADNLFKLEETTLTVSYSGVEASCTISIYFDESTDQYRCTVVDGIAEVLDQALGKGFDEVTPYSVDDLAAVINGLTGLTGVVSGTGTTPAAFIKIVRDHELVSSNDWMGVAGSWSEVDSSATDPFSESFSARYDSDFENVSFAQIQNIMLLSSGREECHKYDGVSLYRAGVPKPATLTSVEGAAGLVTGANYFHRALMVMKDAVGNETFGNYLAVTSGLSPTTKILTVTVANVQASTGFKTNCAIVAGSQSTVNAITVDNGSGGTHTMKAGDTAYFYDGVSSAYVERLVASITATSITVAGAAVTVLDNAVISANLRILIVRNKTSTTTSPSLFYTVAEIPNNSFASTQVYSDNLADASLGAAYVFDSVDRSPPPKGKYITVFQNLPFIAGQRENPYDFFWGDAVAGPECFDLAVNADRVQSSRGDIISGIAPNGKFLAVGCDETIHVGSGTFADGNYLMEERASFIGVSSHASMVQAEGILVFWSNRGPYQMINGQMPIPLGLDESSTSQRIGRIEPVMSINNQRNNQALIEQFFVTKRIIAFNWSDQSKVIFYLPCESETLNIVAANSNSRIYAYDYQRDAWLLWTNLNMAAGVAVLGNEVYFQVKRFSIFSSLMKNELHRVHNLSDAWDYADNDIPIEWEFGAPWEADGDPDVIKNVMELSAQSHEDLQNNSFTLQCDQELNYQENSAAVSFDLEFDSSGYGQSPYSTAAYGDPAALSVKHDMNREKCKSFRVIFKNNLMHQNVLLTSWAYLISRNYRTGFKK